MAHTSDYLSEWLQNALADEVRFAEAKPDPITANCHVSPISILPPELLLDIFSWYKWDVEAENFEDFWGKSRFDLNPTYRCNRWVSITHVCRYWRTLVLKSPDFWTSVEVSIPYRAWNWVEWMLERSDPLPLSTLAIELSKSGHAEESRCLTQFFCEEGIGRGIRSLHLHLRRGYQPSDVQPQAFSPLTLRGLVALYLWADTPSLRWFSEELIQFFANSCRTFQLKVLSLRCDTWDKRLFQDTLTSLDLQGSRHTRMTRNQLYDCLAPLARLTHLRLRGTFFHLPPSTVYLAEPTILSFPQLQSLTLTHDVVEDHDEFLRCASFPPTARIIVKTKVDHVSPVDNIVSLLDTLSKNLSQMPPSHSIRSLHLGFFKDKARAYIKLTHSLPSTGCLPYLEFETGYMPGDFMPALRLGLAEFIMALPAHNLSHVELDSQQFDYRGRVIYELAKMPTLETLRLFIRHGSDILLQCLNLICPSCSCGNLEGGSQLSTLVPRDLFRCSYSEVAQVYFPKLRSLEYCKMDDRRELSDEDISLLRKFLAHCDMGHRVHRAEMRGWGDRTSYPAVETLKAFCDELLWVDK